MSCGRPPREQWPNLPEVGFGRRKETRDGKEVWVTFQEEFTFELWFDEDERPDWWTDQSGRRWRLCKRPDGSWAKTSLGLAG